VFLDFIHRLVVIYFYFILNIVTYILLKLYAFVVELPEQMIVIELLKNGIILLNSTFVTVFIKIRKCILFYFLKQTFSPIHFNTALAPKCTVP
jgi:hypothetical protein